MVRIKKIRISDQLILELFQNKRWNYDLALNKVLPKDAVITHCEHDRMSIIIYFHSSEFEETKEGEIPDDLDITFIDIR